METWEPIEVAIALSLYSYNVSPILRAKRLFDHFDGDCADLMDLIELCTNYKNFATGMAAPTAKVYVDQALEHYGEEARKRTRLNLRAYEALGGTL